MLGFMHNSLEGVDGIHLRDLMGIGRKAATATQITEIKQAEKVAEADVAEAFAELESLGDESSGYESVSLPDETVGLWRSRRRRSHSIQSSLASCEDDSDHPSMTQPGRRRRRHNQATPPPDSDDPMTEGRRSITPTPATAAFAAFMAADLAEDDPADENYQSLDFEGAYQLPDADLNFLRRCLREVELPTHVGRPPTNLGDASHGTLKAQEILVLYTAILPLVMPEIWYSGGETQTQLLENFAIWFQQHILSHHSLHLRLRPKSTRTIYWLIGRPRLHSSPI
jgi:hypothetical protein